ncbi:MAG: ACT domain-containing protein, partial [Geminicoccaceae bacterium]
PGTLVVDEGEIVEQQVVSGIAYSRDEAKVTLVGVSDQPGIAAQIFGPLANANINVDMIVQSVSADGATTDLTFTVGRPDLERARAMLEAMQSDIGCRQIDAQGDVVKISVIGVGMRSHAGIAHMMFNALAERGINIQAISTSEIKISILINEEYTELALRTLHTTYGLDAA